MGLGEVEADPVGPPAGSGPGPGPVTPDRAGIRSLVVALLVLAVIRFPSLFEPHWYTDEAGYANTAWRMAHGAVLYLTTWNNKPPLLFWIYQLGIGISGPNELGIHLLSVLTEGLALGGTWVLARAYLGPRRVWVAVLLAAFFLGTPVFNGDLALPENFLIGLTPWAMVAVLAALRAQDRSRSMGLAAVAGILFAAAILIQQTAIADLGAGLLALVVARRTGWLPAAVTAIAATAVTAAVLAPFVAAAGIHNVVFLLVTSYSGYTSSSLPLSATSIAPRLVAGLLLVLGAWTARRWPAERLLPWVWLPALLLAYGLPNRDYVHFLLPAVPAAALLLARVSVPSWNLRDLRLRMRVAPLLASTLVGAYFWVALLGGSLTQGSLFSLKLTAQYYPAFVGRLTGTLSEADFVSIYSGTATAEYGAMVWILRNHLQGSTGVVWSPNSWLYLLADLRPILPEPTIYVNSALLGQQELIQRVRRERPVVVFITSNSYTEYGPILPVLQRSYTQVAMWSAGELWVRADVAARILTKATSRSVKAGPARG